MNLINLRNSSGYMVTDVAVRPVPPAYADVPRREVRELAVTWLEFSGIAAMVLRNSRQYRGAKAAISVECPEDPSKNGFINMATFSSQNGSVIVSVTHAGNTGKSKPGRTARKIG